MPLLVILFGLIQYGLYFWAYQGGSDIARSAARLSAVGDPADCSSFRADIRSQINGLIGDSSSATITRSYVDNDSSGDLSIGDNWNITVQFDSVDLHFPFVPFIHDGQVTARAEARVDYIPDTSNPPAVCS